MLRFHLKNLVFLMVVTSLSTLSYTYGITGLLIVIFSILIAIYLLYAFVKSEEQSSLTLILAIQVFIMGSPWFGVSTNFLTAYLGHDYIGDQSYLMLASFWIFGLPAALYVTVSLISPERTKIILALSIIISMLMFFVVYILVPAKVINVSTVFQSSPAEAGGLPDAKFIGFLGLYLGISIIVILVSGFLFMLTAYRTQLPLVKARAFPIGSGFIIYAIFGFLDGVVNINLELVVVVVRLGILASLILVMLGVTIPGFVFNRFGIKKEFNKNKFEN